MRSLRALLAVPLVGVLVLGSAAWAAAPVGADLPGPVFADVPADHTFAEDIAWMAGEGIAEGHDDGTFRPTVPVTRMAMAAFLHRYVGPGPDAGCGVPPFPDVAVGHPFCAEITWMVGKGIATGYEDGTFRPDAPVTRQVAAAFLHRLAGAPPAPVGCPPGPFPDVDPASPFCEAIAWLDVSGITTGYADGTFHPTAVLSRMGAAAMVRRYEVADAAAVPSPGCDSSSATPVVNQRRDLEIDGSARWFLHTVPTGHDGVTPLPLVLDFHGLSEGAQVHTVMSEASTFAEAEGFVVAFPHGRFEPVRWDALDQTDGNEDLRFVDAIVETLGEELCLDESRVYAMGLSYGGFMTSLLTCARSDTFAAVAPVAGVRAPEPCEQQRAVPVLAFHGTADAILPYGPYPGFVTTWAERNGCDPDPVDTPVTDEVVHRVYDCPKGADVELYTILDGGHTWPGSAFSQQIAAVVGYTTTDIHATAEAWAFFERHRL